MRTAYGGFAAAAPPTPPKYYFPIYVSSPHPIRWGVAKGKGGVKMTTNAKKTKSSVVWEGAARLLGGAVPQGDLAGPLVDCLLPSGSSLLYESLSDILAPERALRIRTLERELRIRLLRSEEELAKRMAQYASSEQPFDNPPF